MGLIEDIDDRFGLAGTPGRVGPRTGEPRAHPPTARNRPADAPEHPTPADEDPTVNSEEQQP